MNFHTDEQLVGLYLKDQDGLVFEELVKRYLPLLFSFTKRYTGNDNNASDITQETFVKVWKNIKSFDQSKSFKTWIFTIAKRTAIDWLRKKNELPFSSLEKEQNNFVDSLADESMSFFEKLLLQEKSKELVFAVSELPKEYSTVIGFHLNNDLSFSEIALKLKEPLNTVKSRYRRGLILLKKIL